MGFWDTLGNALATVSEMNDEAVSNAAKLSVDDLCQQVNTVNGLTNPLVYTSCVDELQERLKKLTEDDLREYFVEYMGEERTDVFDLIYAEMEERGFFDDDDE